MVKKMKKISRVISVKLFVAVFIAFLVSSAVTYVLLSIFAYKSAYELLKNTSGDIYSELKSRAENDIYNDVYRGLDKYLFEGEKGAEEELEGTNYSYYVHRDGTIFLSGNEEFLGKNVRDIEGIGDLLDACIYNINEGKALSEDVSLSEITAKPVKTLDGKLDVYYIAAISLLNPDVFFVVAYQTDYYMNSLMNAGFILATNRRVGLTGQTVIIDENNRIISSFFTDHTFEEFPDTKLLEQYRNGTEERIEGFEFHILRTPEIYDVLNKQRILDKGEFWGEDYFFYLGDINGMIYICLYPKTEAMSTANNTMIFILMIEIIVFAVLFIVLRTLIKRRIVRKLEKVNASLTEITNGNLEEKVEVRDTIEFDTLSTDINSTVDRLKEYIAEAAARIDADLAIATEIQRSILPTIFPKKKEIEIFASMNAAKEVGGDFYDFFMLDENTLGFLIADVSGKSIPGAMFMMASKTVLKSLAESGLKPAEVFTLANEKLCEGNDAEMFVTAWMGYLDLKTGTIHVANAGHNPPVLIHNGEASYVKLLPGLMLAGMEGIKYKEQTVQLEKGDILYLYTDGVTEAMNIEEEQYGEQRLKSLLSFGKAYPESSKDNGMAESICNMVISDVDKFTVGADQWDDITMLCIRYLGSE